MSKENMLMSKENMLMTIQPNDLAIGFFTQPDGPDAIIDAVRAMANDFNPDLGSDTWQEEVRSFAYKITRTKTTIDNAGKELVAEYKEIPRKIDETRRRLREELDAIRDEVRRPLTDWEEAEKARVENHKWNINAILMALECEDKNLAGLNNSIDEIQKVKIDDSWEEFQEEGQSTKDKVLTKLFTVRDAVQKQEAERAELERLRAEQERQKQAEREARIAQEAAEKARKEAEEREIRLKLEKELAEKREAEARLEAERQAQLAKERAEREAKEAVEAERRRAEQEAHAKKEAEAKRQADIAHRGKVHAEIMEDMTSAGLDDNKAAILLNAIRSGEIRNIKIIY